MKSSEQEIKSIFDKYSRRIVLFCNGMIKNMEESEDITIDVFVELWKRLDNFKTEDNIKAFLFISAKRRCINYLLRKKIKTCEIGDQLANYSDINSTVIESLYNTIYNEVEKLPDKQRGIIKGYLSGLSAHEISAKLGMSYKTVCNVKAVAVNKLKLRINIFEFI